MDSGKSQSSISSAFQPQITQVAQEGLGSSEHLTATNRKRGGTNTRVGQALSMHDTMLSVSLQDNWEPALEELVQCNGQRFSRAFDL